MTERITMKKLGNLFPRPFWERVRERGYKKFAFTLAEVLITLGVIGVVSAMTLPSVIQKQQKKQTAVKLQKFYNVMNNAFTRYYVDEGIMPENFQFDSNTVRNSQNYADWFKNTVGKYIIYTKIKNSGSSNIQVVFSDGSGFHSYVDSIGIAFFMYCTQYKYCGNEQYDGKNSFLFVVRKGKFSTYNESAYKNKRSLLKQQCENPVGGKKRRHFCTALIEMDGWEIKDDYPAW